MGPSSTGCQTPNEQVMSAFSYLPELEKQLIENYEGAVSTHFAVHVCLRSDLEEHLLH
jgi:hypothetical protein